MACTDAKLHRFRLALYNPLGASPGITGLQSLGLPDYFRMLVQSQDTLADRNLPRARKAHCTDVWLPPANSVRGALNYPGVSMPNKHASQEQLYAINSLPIAFHAKHTRKTAHLRN